MLLVHFQEAVAAAVVVVALVVFLLHLRLVRLEVEVEVEVDMEALELQPVLAQTLVVLLGPLGEQYQLALHPYLNCIKTAICVLGVVPTVIITAIIFHLSDTCVIKYRPRKIHCPPIDRLLWDRG